MKPPWIVSAKPGEPVFACEYRDGAPVWRPGRLLKRVDDVHLLVDVSADGENGCAIRRYHQLEVRTAAYCEERSAPTYDNVVDIFTGEQVRQRYG